MNFKAQLHLIGDVLVKKGVLSPDQLRALEEELQTAPLTPAPNLEALLLSQQLVAEDQLLEAYAQLQGIPFQDLDPSQIDAEAVSLIPPKFANKNTLVALKQEGQALTVAIRNPFDLNILDELKLYTKLEIRPVLCRAQQIKDAIKLHYGVGAETIEKLVMDSQRSVAGVVSESESSVLDVDQVASDSSMINYVQQLLKEAHGQRATDIHIEPFERRLRVRHRIDGVLYDAKIPPDIHKLREAIISRFKIMSNLNVAEKRRPQDGRCRVDLDGHNVDLRISTFPTLFGEGMSIRLLSRGESLLAVDQLGLNEKDSATLKDFLSRPNGMLLVTGPTGCGKTTTLYSCVNHLDHDRINIVTLEDPIEYQLEGVNQIQTNPKVDLTFASGLRSILRQDPDVILVGEIRDAETAHIAIRAALTGHLIFSTLHTNNALATIARLLNLGMEPYLLASTLKGVIAQRLARMICPHCKTSYRPQQTMLDLLGIRAKEAEGIEFFKGEGCPECHDTGYQGRMAVFEFLTVDDKISNLIAAGAPKEKLEIELRAAGMQTLRQDGLRKVKAGLTTLDEIVRMTE